ncbi:hypothetical protein QBC39DRAFT_410958 [Podospora conica]|nr:hypothetical protein QBC39DRAFT_410958 [Schizothecium conicum]
MTTSSDTQPVLPGTGASQREAAVDSALKSQGPPRMFKKHKMLPHPTPRKEAYQALALQDPQRSTPRRYRMEADASLSQSPRDAPRAKPRAGGPQPPPTPPAHSRKSSSSHSANPSSPTYIATPLQSSENVRAQAGPATPTNQQTPPTPNLTPDRTPPGQAARPPTKIRPSLNDRLVSRLTSDSRTESFRTAPENPCSSDDDDTKSTLRPMPPSAKTSQSTVRQTQDKRPSPKTIGLGLGLESTAGDDLTPRTAKAFNTFDGDWADRAGGSGSEVEMEWDDNLMRNVTVRKRRPAAPVNAKTKEVVEDLTVTPTNATRALRSMSLQESPIVYPSRRVVSDRFPTRAPPSNSESSISIDLKRSSMMSTRSTASTIVEAILVETAPQRRQTLRHVRKQMTLRDSRSDLSPTSSAPTSVSAYIEAAPRRQVPKPQMVEAPRESYVSTATTNSLSSRKARREVIKSGAIPVVIIPQRRSSNKSSKEPSLRSTSSRRSKRTQSLSSVPTQVSQNGEYALHADRLPRRSRTLSESDGSRPGDQRTIDFPPTIPTRSSSLSAPTSRNVSRTGSLTAESLKAHNAFQEGQLALQGARRALEKIHSERSRARLNSNAPKKEQIDAEPKTLQTTQVEPPRPEIMVRRATSIESETSRGIRHSRGTNESHDIHDHHRERLHVDRYGDPFFGKRLSVQNTPFSQISVTTTGTSQHEVSEAMAVNIYPHQNKSVMLVDHSSSKPSANSSLEQQTPETEVPKIKTTDANGVPMTPPQAFTMDDIDSPLRNPRAAPPAPPAINFIPATPSGLTPGVEKEKMLGNFYDITGEKPKKRPSLLQRTLSRGRQSYYGPAPTRPVGLLARTLSLTRGGGSSIRSSHSKRRHSYADDGPADESRLHPHWRPAYDDEDDYSSSSGSDGSYSDSDSEPERTYRYPRIDNRPRRSRPTLPRRSLSARVRDTLAPLRRPSSSSSKQQQHYSDGRNPTDRRTIRRTPSGNLRVMKFRKSLESMPRLDRAFTADGAGVGVESSLARQFRMWRSPSAAAAPGTASWAAVLGARMNIPRRMSERRREKRTQELRSKISGPREVRDGVGEVLRRTG